VVKDQLLLDREALRAQLNGHLASFALPDRARTKFLEKSTISIEQLLNVIVDDFAPKIKTLENKQTDKNLRNYLMRQLSFDPTGVDLAISHLIEQRRHELVIEAVEMLDPTEHSRLIVANLLITPIDELVDLTQRFVNYQQALDIEAIYGLSLLDAHARRFKRSRMRRHIRREQKRIVRDEKRTLAENQNMLGQLLGGDEILTKIVDNQLSYVEILGLRQNYQKAVNRLKKADQKPSQLIVIFDNTTKTYLERETDRLSGDQQNLKGLSAISDRLRNLLLEIFDLTNEQRNQLMTKMAEYEGLLRDNANIATARANRAKFVQ